MPTGGTSGSGGAPGHGGLAGPTVGGQAVGSNAGQVGAASTSGDTGNTGGPTGPGPGGNPPGTPGHTGGHYGGQIGAMAASPTSFGQPGEPGGPPTGDDAEGRQGHVNPLFSALMSERSKYKVTKTDNLDKPYGDITPEEGKQLGRLRGIDQDNDMMHGFINTVLSMVPMANLAKSIFGEADRWPMKPTP